MNYVIIPARSDSKRLPGKALLSIDGLPMVVRVYKQALKIPNIKQVIVATDSSQIADVVQQYGGIALLTSSLHRNGTERCAEIARRLFFSLNDIVLNLQGDMPYIDPVLCSPILSFAGQKPDTVYTLASICMDKGLHDRDAVKVVVDEKNRALYFSREAISSNSTSWLKHVGAYALSNELLQWYATLPMTNLEKQEDLEQLRFLHFGCPIGVHITETPCLSVNNMQDIGYMNILWPERATGHII